jgi:hypothetical protein
MVRFTQRILVQNFIDDFGIEGKTVSKSATARQLFKQKKRKMNFAVVGKLYI